MANYRLISLALTTLQAHEHQALVWCSPEEALQYPLAPADIPLLEAFMALRAARAAD
ncbi:pyrimidine (deoxy)nucleoside triphosphate pyrophosphohydrolase [Shigella sonnei]|nr:pyrimidine (deoxy)nucleoside triphosphate pyrophosphohydrolase [Shigella sonnei]